MRFLIANNTKIPAVGYGGTERVIWWLGKEFVRLGHEVTYLVAPGSSCPFARVLPYDPAVPMPRQIPPDIDFAHFHFQIVTPVAVPYLITHHGNDAIAREYDINTVFVSLNHAQRHGARAFVHNGLDPEEYGPVDLHRPRRHLLFLGYARRPEKNLKACAAIARGCGLPLAIVGGRKKFGNAWFRLMGSEYMGYLGGKEKNLVLQNSTALLFPVRWHEPFGLAVIEALYFGCPVFGTAYGSLPELITPEVGLLSNSRAKLTNAVQTLLPGWDRRKCHEYARAHFTCKQMAQNYLAMYGQVLEGKTLNPKKPRAQETFSKDKLLPFFE